MPTGAMKLVPPGFRVQLAPPPDSVAVARPAMPGTAPDTDSCALTVKLRLTCGAGKKTPLPAWSALMVQLPAVTNVSAPPLVIVHTPVATEHRGENNGTSMLKAIVSVPYGPTSTQSAWCRKLALALLSASTSVQ